MYFYNALFLIIILTGLFAIKIDKEERTISLHNEGNALLPIAVLFLVQGFRGLRVGTDTYKYARFFLHSNNPGSYRYSSGKDVLYYLWCRLLKMISDNIVFFNCCCAVIIFVSLWHFINVYSSNKMLSVALFLTLGLFFASMNQTRQAMAAAMLLWAYDRACNKAPIQTVVFCLAAIMIHTTTVIFLPIFLFIAVWRKINRYVVELFTIGAVLVAVFMNTFLKLFVWVFPSYAKYIKGILFRERGITIWRYGDWGICIALQVGLLLCLFIDSRKGEDEKEGYILACLNSLAVAVSYLAMKIIAMERIKQYFVYWYIIIIPYILGRLFKKNKLIGIIVACVSLFYMWHLGVRDGHGVIPYRTVINQLNEIIVR